MDFSQESERTVETADKVSIAPPRMRGQFFLAKGLSQCVKLKVSYHATSGVKRRKTGIDKDLEAAL